MESQRPSDWRIWKTDAKSACNKKNIISIQTNVSTCSRNVDCEVVTHLGVVAVAKFGRWRLEGRPQDLGDSKGPEQAMTML